MSLSPKVAKRLNRLLDTLDRARVQMEHSDIREFVDDWRGSINIRDNISEFIMWQSRKLPPTE